jgi:hypothetical protein
MFDGRHHAPMERLIFFCFEAYKHLAALRPTISNTKSPAVHISVTSQQDRFKTGDICCRFPGTSSSTKQNRGCHDAFKL